MLDEKSDGFGGSNESVRAVSKGNRTLESLMRQRRKVCSVLLRSQRVRNVYDEVFSL